ncbi:MAG: methylated-DNA--[protein]-cysteine S-methyltransferase [Planctomycetota bacterium]|nr:methylated-DNA--[protein]-cysteine S-methyltransferase [Planctomycetota bacterium]
MIRIGAAPGYTAANRENHAMHALASRCRLIESPIGLLRATEHDGALVALSFVDDPAEHAHGADARDASRLLDDLQRRLDRYFAGEREDFDLPLAPRGTEFQQRLWRTLRQVPWGKTVSYGELAVRAGRDANTARAAARACATNPVAIVIPCHRVIGANGALTGFAGGMDRKRFLLGLEQADAAGQRTDYALFATAGA